MMPSAIAAQVTCTGQPSGTVSCTTSVIDQKPQRGQSRRKAENEKDGQQDFRRPGGERHDTGRGKAIRAARQVQLELRAEKQHGDIVQLQETVPFVDAGSPERDREREAQDELGQRWLAQWREQWHSLVQRARQFPAICRRC